MNTFIGLNIWCKSMKPLTIVLAEAGLELVPKSVQHHPSVVKNAERRGKKPSETLLDISLHYRAMRSLDKWYKRGRPDIVHISLLNALSSPLNIIGLLKLYIHTVNNIIINIDPLVHIPRNYNRFIGLIEQLLVIGKVPPKNKKPMLWIEQMSLHKLVLNKNFNEVIIMHEKGSYMSHRALGEYLVNYMSKDQDICIIIGAFQHGDFEKEVLGLGNKVVSIFSKPLDTWIVISRVIEGVEAMLKIY